MKGEGEMMFWESKATEESTFDAGGFGARVRQARESAGVSQEGAARKLGLSQPTYSRMEGGRFQAERITATLLDKMSEQFGRPMSFFLHGSPVRDRIRLAARSRAGSSSDVRFLAEAVLDLMEADAELDALEQGPAMRSNTSHRLIPTWQTLADELADAVPGHPSAARGVGLAQCLRDRLELGRAPIADLSGLLEDGLGLEVALLPLKEGLSAIAAFDDERSIAILAVDVSESYACQRFSQAHELGHVLACDAHTELSATGPRTPSERQADRFAQEFLLPQAAIAHWAARRGYGPGERLRFEDACALASDFGVSPQAVWIGLRAVARQPHRSFPTAREAAIAAGHWTRFRQQEAASRVPRIPARIESRVLSAYRAGRLTTGRAAGILFQERESLSGQTLSRHSSGSVAVTSRR